MNHQNNTYVIQKKFPLDLLGENKENYVHLESWKDIKAHQIQNLNHDVFFGDSLEIYQDPQQTQMLTQQIDYQCLQLNESSSLASGKQCYEQIQFLKDFPQVWINYHVVGDWMKAQDFNYLVEYLQQDIQTWSNATSDNLPQGKINLYLQEDNLAKSKLIQTLQAQMSQQQKQLDHLTPLVQGFTSAIEKMTAQITEIIENQAQYLPSKYLVGSTTFEDYVNAFGGNVKDYPMEILLFKTVDIFLGRRDSHEGSEKAKQFIQDHAPQSMMGLNLMLLIWSMIPTTQTKEDSL